LRGDTAMVAGYTKAVIASAFQSKHLKLQMVEAGHNFHHSTCNQIRSIIE
jgi:hypothetical protein